MKCCASSHEPPDTACKSFEAGQNGRCVYCDHEAKCHPGPGATCEIGIGANSLPWAEKVAMLSINPDAASSADVAQLASELINCHQQDRIKTREINVLVKENNELRQRIAAARGLLAPLGNQPIPSVLAIREALNILR